MTVSRTLDVLMNNERCHRMRNLKADALLLQYNCLRPRTLLATRQLGFARRFRPRAESHVIKVSRLTFPHKNPHNTRSKSGSVQQEPGSLVEAPDKSSFLKFFSACTHASPDAVDGDLGVHRFLNSQTVVF